MVCARRPPAAKRLDEESPEEAPPVCGEGEVADGPAELSYKTPKRRCSLKGMFLGSFVVSGPSPALLFHPMPSWGSST